MEAVRALYPTTMEHFEPLDQTPVSMGAPEAGVKSSCKRMGHCYCFRITGLLELASKQPSGKCSVGA